MPEALRILRGEVDFGLKSRGADGKPT